FKGGDWNSAGRYYEFQELHTHTWVEVYLPSESLPPQLARSEMAQVNGVWLILDPTPATGALEEFDESGVLSFRRLSDLTQYLWSTYILGMDSKRQQESIYQPLVEGIDDFVHGMGDPEYRQQLWHKLAQIPAQWGLGENWSPWHGLLAAMLALLLG